MARGRRVDIYERIVAFKLDGLSNTAIAALLNIGKTQLYCHLKDPDYKKIYQQALADVVEVSKDSIAGLVVTSSKIIKRALDDEFTSVQNRVPIALQVHDRFKRLVDDYIKGVDDEELIPVKRETPNG